MATTISANAKLALISELIIMQEGGWVLTNNANDPGGWTYAGVTAKVFTAFCVNRAIPFSLEEFKRNPAQYDAVVYQIYDELYMQPLHFEVLDLPLQGPLFSAAINIGVEKAVLVLQKAMNSFTKKKIGPMSSDILVEDGHLGPRTLEVLGNYKGRTYILKNFFLREWTRYYIKLVVDNAKFWHTVATELLNSPVLKTDTAVPTTFRATNLEGWFNRVEYWRT